MTDQDKTTEQSTDGNALKAKSFSKTTLAVSAAALVAVMAVGAAAYAQNGGMMGRMGGDMGFDFATLDADKDGNVTKVEVEAYHAAKVKAADANADGKLSADELANMQIAAMTERAKTRAAKMVEAMDSDGDGLLSAAEMAVRPGPAMMFDKIDANSDGSVTQAEVDAAKQSMQDHMGGGKGDHGKHGKHGGMMDGMDMGDDSGN